MAINIDTLVHNEFGRSASDQLGKVTGKPSGQIQAGVERAVTEVLDGLSVMAREESGRQTIYEAARYCDDGLVDDPAVFFAGKDQVTVLADSNKALGSLLGAGKRDNISDAVRKASGLSPADADSITGFVAPGVLGVMKRQMLNGAVLDNSDGIGQMLLGETTTARAGGAGASVDHTVPKHAPRQTQTTHAKNTHAASSAPSSGSGAAVASTAHDEGSDLSWMFRWMLPALLLGGLVLAGMRGCGMQQVAPVAVVDPAVEQLALVQGEVDGLNGQITALTSERDEALSDRETAVAEIERLQGELDGANASAADTAELDAANAEIASLKEELAKPADTSELDAANSEIAMLKEELAKPTDNSALNAANATIVGLKSQLANVAEPADNSAEIMSLQKNVDDSALRVTQLESELGTVRESRDGLEEMLAMLNAEKSTAEARTTELKDKLLNVAGAKNRLEAELGGLQESVANGEAANAEKQSAIDDLNAQLEANASEQKTLEAEVVSLKSELQLVTDKRAELEQTVASLTTERDSAVSNIEVVQGNLGRAIDDASAQRKAAVASQQEVLSLQKTIADNDASLAKVTKGRSAAITTVTDLARKLRASETERSAFEATALKASEKNDYELAKMTRSRNYIRNDRNEIRELLADAQGKNEKFDYELAKMTRSRDYIRNDRNEIRELLAEAQGKNEKFDYELAKMTRSRDYIRNDREETRTKLEKASKGRTAAVTTIKSLLGKLKGAESERDALASESEDLAQNLEKATKGRTAAVTTIKSLLGKLESAESERDALAADKEGLEQTIANADSAMQAEKDQVASVSSSLFDQLSSAGLSNVSVSPIEDNQAVGITMGSSDLYGVGSANLSARGTEMLGAVGAIVSQYSDWRIDVEGHTDGQGIGSALRQRYASNWELSVARAAAAVRYLQSDVGIPAEQLSVRGFGEHRPVDTNETAAGREANRRIELILRK